MSVASLAQSQLAQVQNNTFNSSYTIPQSLIKQSGIDAALEHNTNVALNFEHSNWAQGSVQVDGFYTVPARAQGVAPGTLLKVETNTTTEAYTLPPNTALSRIMFQSETANGTAVPASAYILWPYLAREGDDGYQIVAFAHGACGTFGNCAPSHLRSLWYHFEVPFEVAIQGYVVVAPDYQGLGVQTDADGDNITHPFLANSAEANDMFYAVQAAQKAFPCLGSKFVTMGHSQGGGAAWGCAERQARRPVEGYLGTIPMSPATNILTQTFINAAPPTNNASSTALLMARAVLAMFPDFDPSSILHPAGIKRLELLTEIQGCNAVVSELVPSTDQVRLVKQDWVDNFYVNAYVDQTGSGNKTVAGPMLVIQGLADPAVPPNLTISTVEETCATNPDQSIELYTFEGVGHTPVCYASRQIYLDWIAARFSGKPLPAGCSRHRKSSIWPYSQYQYETDWFIEYAA